MQKWEYLTMIVNSIDEYGVDLIVTYMNGKSATVGKDFFGIQFPSFYERINSAGQEGWELAGIDNCTHQKCAIYVFKRPIPPN